MVCTVDRIDQWRIVRLGRLNGGILGIELMRRGEMRLRNGTQTIRTFAQRIVEVGMGESEVEDERSAPPVWKELGEGAPDTDSGEEDTGDAEGQQSRAEHPAVAASAGGLAHSGVAAEDEVTAEGGPAEDGEAAGDGAPTAGDSVGEECNHQESARKMPSHVPAEVQIAGDVKEAGLYVLSGVYNSAQKVLQALEEPRRQEQRVVVFSWSGGLTEARDALCQVQERRWPYGKVVLVGAAGTDRGARLGGAHWRAQREIPDSVATASERPTRVRWSSRRCAVDHRRCKGTEVEANRRGSVGEPVSAPR